MHRILRGLVGVAVAAAVGVALLGVLLGRDGLGALDVVVLAVLLAAPAVVAFFAVGVRELLELPERLMRLPHRGVEHVEELTRLAEDARGATWRRAPFLVWRLRSLVSSTRDLVGIALPLRVLAPPFLALTLVAVVVCGLLVGAGLIALVVLAIS